MNFVKCYVCLICGLVCVQLLIFIGVNRWVLHADLQVLCRRVRFVINLRSTLLSTNTYSSFHILQILQVNDLLINSFPLILHDGLHDLLPAIRLQINVRHALRSVLKVHILKSLTILVSVLTSLWNLRISVDAHIWSEWLHESVIVVGACSCLLPLISVICYC